MSACPGGRTFVVAVVVAHRGRPRSTRLRCVRKIIEVYVRRREYEPDRAEKQRNAERFHGFTSSLSRKSIRGCFSSIAHSGAIRYVPVQYELGLKTQTPELGP